MIQIPEDFKEFLKLLNKNEVEYLLVGGYAVGFYGYPRPTADMDIWVSNSQENAEKVVSTLKEFGFLSDELSIKLLTKKKSIVQMGVEPFKLEILTFISGVEFVECFNRKEVFQIDGVPVNVINLKHLKINKKASGRLKDLNDLENLPR